MLVSSLYFARTLYFRYVSVCRQNFNFLLFRKNYIVWKEAAQLTIIRKIFKILPTTITSRIFSRVYNNNVVRYSILERAAFVSVCDLHSRSKEFFFFSFLCYTFVVVLLLLFFLLIESFRSYASTPVAWMCVSRVPSPRPASDEAHDDPQHFIFFFHLSGTGESRP